MMRYAYALEEGIQFLVFTSPIRLHGNDFAIKKAFNKTLKIMKTLKDFRFVAKQINPSEFTEIIDKTNIIIEFAYRSRCGTPYI